MTIILSSLVVFVDLFAACGMYLWATRTNVAVRRHVNVRIVEAPESLGRPGVAHLMVLIRTVHNFVLARAVVLQ